MDPDEDSADHPQHEWFIFNCQGCIHMTPMNQGGPQSLICLSEIPALEYPQPLSQKALTALQCHQPRPGEIYTVMDPAGTGYRARLAGLSASQAVMIPFYTFSRPVESAVHLHVYQALPEKERFELILEKLTELGVHRIVPFESARSTTLSQREARQKKSHRWPHVVLRAVRQCRRAMIPELFPVMQWQQVPGLLSHSDRAVVLSEKENRQGFKTVLDGICSGVVSLIVGPEGGLDRAEVDAVQQAGGYAVSLGSRILRTETAAVVGAALIQHEIGGL